MSKKNHIPGPVPPDNRPQVGSSYEGPDKDETAPTHDGDAGPQQDPKRRLGGYTTKGEHSIQQPGPKNDG